MKPSENRINIAFEQHYLDWLPHQFIRLLDLFSNPVDSFHDRFRQRAFSLLLILYFSSTLLLSGIYVYQIGIGDPFSLALVATMATSLLFLIENARVKHKLKVINYFIFSAQLLAIVGVGSSPSSDLSMSIGLCSLLIFSCYFLSAKNHFSLALITAIGFFLLILRSTYIESTVYYDEINLWSWSILIIISLLSTIFYTYLKLIQKEVQLSETERLSAFLPTTKTYKKDWIMKLIDENFQCYALKICVVKSDQKDYSYRSQAVILNKIKNTFPDNMIASDTRTEEIILLIPKQKNSQPPSPNIIMRLLGFDTSLIQITYLN